MIILDPHTEDAAADPDAYADLIPECTAFLPSALESERIAGPDHEQAARDYVARRRPDRRGEARARRVRSRHREGGDVRSGPDGLTDLRTRPVPATRSAERSRQPSPRAAAPWKRHKLAVRAGAHMVRHAGTVAALDALPSKARPQDNEQHPEGPEDG